MENKPFDEHRDRVAAESEPFPLTDARKAEIARRIAEHERNPESAVTWKEVRGRLRKRLRVE